MNRIALIAAAVFFLAPIAAFSQSSRSANLIAPMSPQEARDLVKKAHSAAEYRQLAGYFHQQEADYRAKAADEKVEMDRRSQVNSPLYQKYPRPVDMAKALYDSYTTCADSAALQAKHFGELAAGQGHS